MKSLNCANCNATGMVIRGKFAVCSYCGSQFKLDDEPAAAVGFAAPKGGTSHFTFQSNGASTIDLDDDVSRLLAKCKREPKNARKYANLILDIDPDNQEARRYLR